MRSSILANNYLALGGIFRQAAPQIFQKHSPLGKNSFHKLHLRQPPLEP
jgi:hypothetical protein